MKRFLKIFLDNREEENRVDKLVLRKRTAFFVLLSIFIVEMAALFLHAGIIPEIDKKVDLYAYNAKAEADAKYVVPGNIYDRNKELLVEHKQVTKVGKYTNSYAYTQILGYTQADNDTFYSERYDDEGRYIAHRKNYRLLEYLEDSIYRCDEGYNTNKGLNVVLTLDHNLQMEVYRLLKKEMSMKNTCGSAVVLDAKTSDIIVNVAFPTYDVSDVSKMEVQMNSTAEELAPRFPVTHKSSRNPGSTFKIVTTVALIDNGMEDFSVRDVSFNVKNVKIVNSYGDRNEEIDYKEAFSRSSNVFYAKAALELGSEKLTETAKKFRIGENNLLDFASMASKWELSAGDSKLLAATGYGQGKVELSTLHAAMITQCIANDGLMVYPHLIREIIDAKGEVKENFENERESVRVTSTETADKVTEAMKMSTVEHLYAVDKADREIFQKYSVAIKTGTGENGSEQNPNNAWVVSFAPADEPKYIVVVNQMMTEKYGKDLMDTTAGIYKCLFEKK